MKLDKNKIKGIFPAIVTPTDNEGNVNSNMAKKLTSFLIDSGVSGLVPVGGTGEFTSLSPGDRTKMVESVVDANSGRVPVIAGVLSPGLKEAVEAGLDFKRAGADGILLLTPFYVLPEQDALRAYFGEFISRVGLPVVLYENPSRTNVTIEPETYRKIVTENELVIGFKAANTDIVRFCRTILLIGDKVGVLGGWEHMFTSHMVLGAQGGLLALCNVFPKACVKICDLCLEGDFVTARRLHADMIPFFDAAFAEGFPGLVKKAMELIGYDVGYAQKPIAKPSQAAIDRLNATVKPLIENPIENRG